MRLCFLSESSPILVADQGGRFAVAAPPVPPVGKIACLGLNHADHAVETSWTLPPGDIIVTAIPAGVGFVRKPRTFMNHGDFGGIAGEGIGAVCNPARDEVA